VDVAKPEERLNLEVVVGPTPEISLAAESVKCLLTAYKCNGTVRQSAVPYREVENSNGGARSYRNQFLRGTEYSPNTKPQLL
jgi:hypothetical protein